MISTTGTTLAMMTVAVPVRLELGSRVVVRGCPVWTGVRSVPVGRASSVVERPALFVGRITADSVFEGVGYVKSSVLQATGISNAHTGNDPADMLAHVVIVVL